MQIASKTNGDTLSATEFNQITTELQTNLITKSGQTPASGTLTQVGVAVASIAAQGGVYSIDSGAADAYVLTQVSPFPAPFALTDGMTIRFRPGNNNTGACTANAFGFGAKSIKLSDGTSDPAAGDLSTTRDAILRYKLSTTVWLLDAPTDSVVATSSADINNLGLAISVGASALTIALKTKSGSDPSAGSPVKIGFRNSTVTTGTYNIRSVTGALSLVISSGSTLGSSNGVAYDYYIYTIDNAGTVELAVSMTYFEDGSIQSTTAEGGAGAADSNRVLYSTTARANVPIRLIGKFTATEATAGTWATAPSALSLVPFNIPPIFASYNTAAGQSIANGSTVIVNFDSKVQDTHNAVVTGASWTFTTPKTGIYCINSNIRYANGLAWSANSYISNFLYVNNSLVNFYDYIIQAAGSYGQGISRDGYFEVYLNAGDTLNVRTSQGEGSSRALVASSPLVFITISEKK